MIKLQKAKNLQRSFLLLQEAYQATGENTVAGVGEVLAAEFSPAAMNEH